MCISSGILACVHLAIGFFYTDFPAIFAGLLVHTLGSCCQKETLMTHCPFGSQNTRSTCFLHLYSLSLMDTTEVVFLNTITVSESRSESRTFGALFPVLKATWRHLDRNIRCLLCSDVFGKRLRTKPKTEGSTGSQSD